MSEEAVAVVKAFNDHLIATGEILWDVIDPEVVVIDHDIPDSADYQGHRGFEKWLFEDWGSAWESYSFEHEKFVDVGDVIVSVFTVTARGRGSGVEIEARNATVNTIRDGLITRLEYFTTEQEALEAAGLARTEER